MTRDGRGERATSDLARETRRCGIGTISREEVPWGWRLGRRGFLALMAAAAFFRGGVKREAFAATSVRGRSRVITVHDPRASAAGTGFDNADVDADVVRGMVQEGVLAFTGARDLQTAWRQIIPDPAKRVAIKVNCQIEAVYTKSKVVQPIVEGLLVAGVAAGNIVIYDMTDHAFHLAGFRRNSGPGVKVGTVSDFGGYSRFYNHRLARLLCNDLSGGLLPLPGVRFHCDYLINVPVLKALDGYCGVTLSMKNHYGSIANPGEHHKDIMEHIPLVNSLPEIREKTRLVVLDAIFGSYRWVNGRDQKYLSRVDRLLLSDDPVAVDAVGWRLIEKLRKENGMAAVAPPPRYIQRAAELGIGVADPSRIELVQITM
ncbi:DUF362 domain-containing protein [Geomonas sp. RF6]|uniref:DUF362 domain-containing protein n=1 Tax=Geomonas sp. RF6 TaxID=2897342 RepID=UPI001E49F2A6|nr:DUF362 domain-containing protein [Geomonas sp. RF6]UFS69132.1 DUF362 domain-containing protein [Geomonas sp. RF6]